MTGPDEMDAILKVIEHELTAAGFNEAEELCYGSDESYRKAAAEYKAVRRIYEAVPATIRKEYAARKRKAEADRLRAKADAIEAGRATASSLS